MNRHFCAIKAFQKDYKVPNSRVVYDANGVGAFIGGNDTGFIPNSIPFINNAKAIPNPKDPRQYNSLKDQCYFLSGDRVTDSEYYITPLVANMMYDDKMTIRQRILYERKAIKRAVRNNEEPYKLIQKKEMKAKYLSGDSPDLLDMFMMNEYFYLVPKRSAPTATNVSRR